MVEYALHGREFKDALFAQFAEIGSAFASPKRIELIDVLAQGERNVETLAVATAPSAAATSEQPPHPTPATLGAPPHAGPATLSPSNTSRRLRPRSASILAAARKCGPQVFSRLADPMVLRGYRALQALSQARLAEVDRLVRDYFTSTDGLEPVPQEELLRRARRRDMVVLDVRPRQEYAAGHIAGALSLPLAELKRRLADLPKGKKIVAYCRGPYCVLAAEAVRLLRRRGFDAVRLADGYPEWRDAGLPVEHARRPAAQEQRA